MQIWFKGTSSDSCLSIFTLKNCDVPSPFSRTTVECTFGCQSIVSSEEIKLEVYHAIQTSTQMRNTQLVKWLRCNKDHMNVHESHAQKHCYFVSRWNIESSSISIPDRTIEIVRSTTAGLQLLNNLKHELIKLAGHLVAAWLDVSFIQDLPVNIFIGLFIQGVYLQCHGRYVNPS